MSKHTSTPWNDDAQRENMGKVYGADGNRVTDCFMPGTDYDLYQANAAYIVKCVNSHAALVEANRQSLLFLREFIEGQEGAVSSGFDKVLTLHQRAQMGVERAKVLYRAAIKSAGA